MQLDDVSDWSKLDVAVFIKSIIVSPIRRGFGEVLDGDLLIWVG